MATKKSYRRYSPEFKREAIKRACEEGITDAAVCKELGISTRQFRRWRDELHLLGEDTFLVGAELVMMKSLGLNVNWLRKSRSVTF